MDGTASSTFNALQIPPQFTSLCQHTITIMKTGYLTLTVEKFALSQAQSPVVGLV